MNENDNFLTRAISKYWENTGNCPFDSAIGKPDMDKCAFAYRVCLRKDSNSNTSFQNQAV